MYKDLGESAKILVSKAKLLKHLAKRTTSEGKIYLSESPRLFS